MGPQGSQRRPWPVVGGEQPGAETSSEHQTIGADHEPDRGAARAQQVSHSCEPAAIGPRDGAGGQR